jgi:uncharacterized membrane protein
MKVSARIILSSIWGILCMMIITAPFLMTFVFPSAAATLYFSFSFFCHQIPDRSFMISHYPFAVCHRCFGIYLGFFLGALFENRWIYSSVKLRRAVVFAALLPMGIDFSLEFGGLWSGTPGLRFVTGLVFGCLISPLLVRGFIEMLQDIPWRGRVITAMSNNGDFS